MCSTGKRKSQYFLPSTHHLLPGQGLRSRPWAIVAELPLQSPWLSCIQIPVPCLSPKGSHCCYSSVRRCLMLSGHSVFPASLPCKVCCCWGPFALPTCLDLHTAAPASPSAFCHSHSVVPLLRHLILVLTFNVCVRVHAHVRTHLPYFFLAITLTY